MRYILPLLFITLISASTSINVNNTKENAFDEINSLQSNCNAFIRKKLAPFYPLMKKIQDFFGEGKILQLVEMADINIKNITDEDKKLLKKYDKYVKKHDEIDFGKLLFLLSNIEEDSIKRERVSAIDNIRDDVFKNKRCRKDYEIIRDLYKQLNKFYEEIKSDYEQIKNLYTKYSMQEEYKRIFEKPLKL